MTTNTIRVAMGQMLVEGGAVDQNLARAHDMIGQAADQRCQIVVLPECCDAGWTFPRAGELAEPIPGTISQRLARAASEAHAINGSRSENEQPSSMTPSASAIQQSEAETLKVAPHSGTGNASRSITHGRAAQASDILAPR